MRNLVKTGLAATLLVAAASPAYATSFVFDTNKGGSVTGSGDGNARIYQAKRDGQTLNMRATGWSVASDAIVRNSYLGSYAGGLGVISGDENGSGNTHVVDNQNRVDFLLLQFDQAVTLSGAELNAFGFNGSTDTDATVAWGNSPFAWNGALPFNDQSLGTMSGFFNGSLTSLGSASSGTRTFATGNTTANLWLLGAALNNADHRIDGFKVASITANTPGAVPEPATWAMMIFGFGAVGGSMRYRRRRTVVAFA